MNMSRYLLIDDDDIIQFIHNKVVSSADPGAQIHAVFSVEKALEHLTSLDWGALPDYIFIDINMPIQSGFDFLDALKSDHPALNAALLEHSKVFLLTSSVNPRDQKKAMEYPVIDQMLSKPLTPEKMKELSCFSPETSALS